MHVNLRPSSTPGGGPGTANTAFIVRASDPSPETFSVALPTPQPGWCYVQADARWHGGKATSPKVPIPGSHVCDSPSPSPTPTPTSSVPPSAPHPTPTSTVPTLPKTGSAGVSGTRTVGLLALLSGLGLVVAARLRKPAWARH